MTTNLSLELDKFCSRDIEANTRQWYRRMCQPLLNKATCPSEITNETLQAIHTELSSKPSLWGSKNKKIASRKKLTAATINGHIRAINIFIKWLNEKGLLDANIKPLKRIKEQSRGLKYITPTNKRLMLGEAKKTRDLLLLRMFASTGCRIAGIAQMKINDFEFKNDDRSGWQQWPIPQDENSRWRGRAAVKEKRGKKRVVYLSNATCKLLFQHLQETNICEHIFTNAQGNPLTTWGIRLVLKRIAQRAGVSGPSNPHAWRHAFAKELISSGANTRAVADLLGHASIITTMTIYLSYTDDELNEQHHTHYRDE